MQATQCMKCSNQAEQPDTLAEESTNKDTKENTNTDTNLALLLRNVIDALTQSDAERLQQLSLSIVDGTSLSTGSALAEVQSLHRLLGALLQESRRNLRVWRRASGMHSREFCSRQSYSREFYRPFYR
ncbi:response regulator RpfG family c-di-GMP phosphodiesterase [Silvibacterium bohemicum]|uniref:Response regulator RpfG family c-di-GMP phosphodiesterase n=2 Tax=Silvibacterium bohemicum TaxID=1577686 RepID=A0A841K120_9BACT|nr:response regulator RpfG family c-di-GMP phosphodiesterase [Silvibacterium bohemicum]